MNKIFLRRVTVFAAAFATLALAKCGPRKTRCQPSPAPEEFPLDQLVAAGHQRQANPPPARRQSKIDGNLRGLRLYRCNSCRDALSSEDQHLLLALRPDQEAVPKDVIGVESGFLSALTGSRPDLVNAISSSRAKGRCASPARSNAARLFLENNRARLYASAPHAGRAVFLRLHFDRRLW